MSSDKPAIVSTQEPITPVRRVVLEHRYQCRLETLPAVDRGVAQIVDALREEGELDDTIIVFSSDNGTFQGQHRLPGGKGLAYDEAAHLPLVIRAPEKFTGAAPRARVANELVANIDYAPTVVEWAGTETCPEAGECRVMDGRSLMPLLGAGGAWPAERAIATELRLNNEGVQPGRGISCEFQGARQGRWLYIRHLSLPDPDLGACLESDESELYDHVRDPFELENVAGAPAGLRAAAVLQRMRALAEELAVCAGIEGRDPEPESGVYCK